METVPIPRSAVTVSRIGLGTWAIGGWMWGGTDEALSIATIRSAVERGITLIDTAPVYGFGRSEEIVGKALAEGGLRSQVAIATKVGIDWPPGGGQPFRNASRQRIFNEVEDSLQRLQTDVIDIYQVHWRDPETPIAETAEAMRDLHAQGKIKAIGVSNYSAKQMETFASIAPLHVAPPPFNLFERDIEGDVLPFCRAHDVATLTYGALCRGLLSGKMTAIPRSLATICAAWTRNFNSRVSAITSPRSRASTALPKARSISGSFILPCVGFWTSLASARACGAPAVPNNSTRSVM